MAKHYNAKVKPRYFRIGDLVLRKVTWPLNIPHKGSKDPTGKVHTKSLIAIGRAPITWRHSTGKGCTIHGMLSTSEDTINNASTTTCDIAYDLLMLSLFFLVFV